MALEGFVQVNVDGAGKRMRNALRYALQPDGTLQPVYEELIQLVDSNGNPVDFSGSMDDLKEEIRNLSEIIAAVSNVDPLASVPRVLSQTGLIPAQAAPFNPVKQLGDGFGRQVVLLSGMRDMIVSNTITISASTTETTLLTGLPDFFLDPFLIIVSNTSAATSTRVDIRDSTGGTIRVPIQSVGGGPPSGFALPIPIPQAKKGDNWTAQCATSTTDVRITIYAIKNR